jgi:translation initiation factor 1A
MSKKKEEQARHEQEQEEIRRIFMPRPPQVFGMVEQRLGGSRMSVRCMDGITRVTRIPGRLKRKLWVREGDIVVVEPWEYANDKGDILFKYRKSQVDYLKKQGRLKKLEDVEEF